MNLRMEWAAGGWGDVCMPKLGDKQQWRFAPNTSDSMRPPEVTPPHGTPTPLPASRALQPCVGHNLPPQKNSVAICSDWRRSHPD